eukprot:COSAG01_NODE_3211_length_6414_cov_7.800475_3_plen_61_part_00
MAEHCYVRENDAVGAMRWLDLAMERDRRRHEDEFVAVSPPLLWKSKCHRRWARTAADTPG